MLVNIQKRPGDVIQPIGVVDDLRSTGTNNLDATLIERVASGEKLAMRALYARHHVRIYRFALRIVGDETVAEELVNEVFLEIWRKAHTFARRSRASTWLFAITRHKALDALRRRSTKPLEEDAYEAVEDISDDPETTVQKKQRGAIVLKCLARLSPAHREIVDLVYYHHKSINDVAEITGIEPSTVKTRMFYARKRLAILLTEQGIDTA
jgi:RNA polymerase sigma-70 factor (ECF subfamily)